MKRSTLELLIGIFISGGGGGGGGGSNSVPLWCDDTAHCARWVSTAYRNKL